MFAEFEQNDIIVLVFISFKLLFQISLGEGGGGGVPLTLKVGLWFLGDKPPPHESSYTLEILYCYL